LRERRRRLAVNTVTILLYGGQKNGELLENKRADNEGNNFGRDDVGGHRKMVETTSVSSLKKRECFHSFVRRP